MKALIALIAAANVYAPYTSNGIVGIIERAGFAGLTAVLVWWLLGRLSGQIDTLCTKIERLSDAFDNHHKEK